MSTTASATAAEATTAAARQRQRALSRWDNEGGADPDDADDLPVRKRHRAEMTQLHMRVIALEHLVIVLLAESSSQQLDCVRELSEYITPRPGNTLHPLTVRASAQMLRLVERSDGFRDLDALDRGL